MLAFMHEDIGGYEGLVDKYFQSEAKIRASKEPNGTELCGAVPSDAMHLLRSVLSRIVNCDRIPNIFGF